MFVSFGRELQYAELGETRGGKEGMLVASDGNVWVLQRECMEVSLCVREKRIFQTRGIWREKMECLVFKRGMFRNAWEMFGCFRGNVFVF